MSDDGAGRTATGRAGHRTGTARPTAEALPFDPSEPLPRLRRELDTGPDGLSAREAARRLAVHGPNEVRRKAGPSVWREVATQLAHPLALLLWAAAALAFVADLAVLGWAVLAVIVVNAGFALLQERQAERAVETLARYLPEHALVVRDGHPLTVEARELVPGDVVLLEEGGKVPADARVTEGGVEVDLSMLTGESVPAERVAVAGLLGAPLLEEPNLVFSGTTCIEGQARAVVFATGDRTELGRIAALSQRTRREASPLERQVKKVAWLIAAVATGMGAVFLVVGVAVGLPVTDALMFAIGLLVANVPEGLLPTITLALAVGVRALARQGALVKRLSAVETLGSTSVICTDKTGTLTRNRMHLRVCWTPGQEGEAGSWAQELVRAAAECTTVTRDVEDELHGDPTETALVEGAAELGAPVDLVRRDERRQALFRFDPRLRMMTVVQGGGTSGPTRVVVKGAPEAVLEHVLPGPDREAARDAVQRLAGAGTRVLAVAVRDLPADGGAPARRQGVISRDMLIRSWGYLGLVSAVLVMTGFLYVLWRAGWQPGDPTGEGASLHGAYVTATTATFAGIITCQIGTAFAARTDHAALREIGVLSNPLLLAGIAFELCFTAALVYAPPLQRVFGTAALPWDVVLLIGTFPLVVWGVDEARRARRRRQRARWEDAGSLPPWSRRKGG
ncbi:HAD-IC family P-type ATPase [Streptomyces roseolus]|uniref:HAD-IC family P-type ATPase n=1 Tax=Streptomyces roseolus TaxID=67358 RepID=UPI0037B7A9AD